jgi:anti-sigma factor RsiW
MHDMQAETEGGHREHQQVFAQLDAYLDGELSAEQSDTVAAHVRGCHACRQRLAELRGVERVYNRVLAEEGEPSPEYREHVLERLRSADAGR